MSCSCATRTRSRSGCVSGAALLRGKDGPRWPQRRSELHRARLRRAEGAGSSAEIPWRDAAGWMRWMTRRSSASWLRPPELTTRAASSASGRCSSPASEPRRARRLSDQPAIQVAAHTAELVVAPLKQLAGREAAQFIHASTIACFRSCAAPEASRGPLREARR